MANKRATDNIAMKFKKHGFNILKVSELNEGERSLVKDYFKKTISTIGKPTSNIDDKIIESLLRKQVENKSSIIEFKLSEIEIEKKPYTIDPKLKYHQ